jgi:hypothetical protein
VRQTLIPHPDSVCRAVARIEVEASRPRPRRLVLQFVAAGAMTGVRIPAKAMPLRARELWRHSCFEAFVRARGDEGYYELNFAPSTEWAAYRFEGRREGMRTALEVHPARIAAWTNGLASQLRVELDLPAWMAAKPWHVGLSAVIEARSRARSYWALVHPARVPDFHHPGSFLLDLPPPRA